MKMTLSRLLAISALTTVGFTATSNAAVIIDTNFSGVTGTDLPLAPNGKLYRNTLKDVTDDGWQAGNGFRQNSDFDDTAGTLLISHHGFEPYAFGQVNDDSNATTGDVAVEFAVSAFTGSTTDLKMQVEFFSFSTTVPTAIGNTAIGLQNTTVENKWTPIGTATTGAITAPGTFTTDTVDFGAGGHDIVAARITVIGKAATNVGDSITLSSVTPVTTVIPEPASLALIGLGSLLLAGRRTKA